MILYRDFNLKVKAEKFHDVYEHDIFFLFYKKNLFYFLFPFYICGSYLKLLRRFYCFFLQCLFVLDSRLKYFQIFAFRISAIRSSTILLEAPIHDSLSHVVILYQYYHFFFEYIIYCIHKFNTTA